VQRINSTLYDIVAGPADALKRRFGVLLGFLEICLLPHGQGFRLRCKRATESHAAMPQGRAAEKRGSFKADIHRQQQRDGRINRTPEKAGA
jgi:hypothetical protein